MLTIKICGLTTLGDAQDAVEAGATFLGFVLYRKSPRYVTPEHLRQILQKLPGGARAVGVFVNEDPKVVARVAITCHLHAIQLHGDEDPADFAAMPAPVWRAIRLNKGTWTPNPELWKPELFVMDAAAPTYGGSGLRVDWEMAAGFADQHRSLLAGGLNPKNVVAAIQTVRPLGVDVSSGVETMPGLKDQAKVMEFIRAARSWKPKKRS